MMYRRILFVVTLTAAVGCSKTDFYTGAFNAPSFAAVAMPSENTPFVDPVGFVANRKGGQIAVIALEDGRFLADDPVASFVRGNPLATGHERILSSISTWSTPNQLTVFAGDLAQGQLLEVPYLLSAEDGRPVEQDATATAPTFTDADASGDNPSLNELMVQAGYTSTEDWTIRRQGAEWWITGSRSGQLETPAQSGVPYTSETGVLSFEITGDASDGDFFSFSSDSGIVEHDIGGGPLHMSMAPDQDLLAVITQSLQDASRTLNWWDPANQTLTPISLPPDSAPARVSWSEDGQTLYVADEGRASAWSVAKGEVVPTEYSLPWPTVEVAALDSGDTPSLYVVPHTNRSVWQLDLTSGTLVDLNPETPETDGLNMDTSIRGLEAIPLEYAFPVYTSEGIQRWGRSVAVSLYSGPIVFLDEETGCLIQDALGPRTVPNSDFGANFDYGSNVETNAGPFLQINAANDRHVVVNACSGVALSEFWTVTFDENLQGWEVEGSSSGVQSELALEDKRYVTDDGAVSFVIRSGSSPSADGTTFRFSIDRGSLDADGDNDKDGQIGEGEFTLSLPSAPVFFHYRPESPEGGWETVDDRAMLLVASEGSNFVSRVNPSNAALEVIWE